MMRMTRMTRMTKAGAQMHGQGGLLARMARCGRAQVHDGPRRTHVQARLPSVAWVCCLAGNRRIAAAAGRPVVRWRSIVRDRKRRMMLRALRRCANSATAAELRLLALYCALGRLAVRLLRRGSASACPPGSGTVTRHLGRHLPQSRRRQAVPDLLQRLLRQGVLPALLLSPHGRRQARLLPEQEQQRAVVLRRRKQRLPLHRLGGARRGTGRGG